MTSCNGHVDIKTDGKLSAIRHEDLAKIVDLVISGANLQECSQIDQPRRRRRESLVPPATDDFHDRLLKLEILMDQLRRTKRSNPGVVGLAGFGTTTLMLQFVNCGWMNPGPVLALSLAFGGVAQLCAGLMEFVTGNNFGFCVMCTYGSFWISFGIVLLLNNAGIYATTELDTALYLLPFLLLSTIFLIASFRTDFANALLFVDVVIGLSIGIIAHFANSKVLVQIGGFALIPTAFMAYYIMADIVLADLYGGSVLPMGPSFHQLFTRYVQRK